MCGLRKRRGGGRREEALLLTFKGVFPQALAMLKKNQDKLE